MFFAPARLVLAIGVVLDDLVQGFDNPDHLVFGERDDVFGTDFGRLAVREIEARHGCVRVVEAVSGLRR